MAEIFWYITAALLAGVGTGLVGLSAATVMVPILIVLCPSFSGETGAYPHVGDWRWSRRAGGSPVWKAPCGAAAGRPQEDMGGNRGYGACVQGDRNGGYAGADCDALASMRGVCFGRICSRGLYRAYHLKWQRHSNRPCGRCRGAPSSCSFDCELKRQFVSFCLSIFSGLHCLFDLRSILEPDEQPVLIYNLDVADHLPDRHFIEVRDRAVRFVQ